MLFRDVLHLENSVGHQVILALYELLLMLLHDSLVTKADPSSFKCSQPLILLYFINWSSWRTL